MWFLVRVVPKPSRMAYPCQRVAMPLASGFLGWILGAAAGVFAFGKARLHFRRSRYVLGACFLALAGTAVVVTSLVTSETAFAGRTGRNAFLAFRATGAAKIVEIEEDHDPVGTAKGIKPGRVVWIHDTSATNAECTNEKGDYWWQDGNTRQSVVDAMLAQGVRRVTGKGSDESAWEALFRHYNKAHDRGERGYEAGEGIAIKVNLCSAYGIGNYVKRDPGGGKDNDEIKMIDTSPQMMRALLRQLVDVAGVPQGNIVIGDPMRPFFEQFHSMLRDEFPDVVYLDPWGKDGRTKVVESRVGEVKYSDPSGKQKSNRLPQRYVHAAYFINLSVLKGHSGAGISMGAKNHFGSHAFGNEGGTLSLSEFLHGSLPGSWTGGPEGMGYYRNLVDLLGHEHLGGKTIISIVDGLWGAYESIGDPNKWRSEPFNNNWPSSILLSQDPVALESVGFDLLRNEYTPDNGYDIEQWCSPNTVDGTEDYLHQAASPSAWPDGVEYDPEQDGTPLTSLGVHEHWDSPETMEYSRNIDPDGGKGIELVRVEGSPVRPFGPEIARRGSALLGRSWPNPFSLSTVIPYYLPRGGETLVLEVLDPRGRVIATLAEGVGTAGQHTVTFRPTDHGIERVGTGQYLCRLRSGQATQTIRMQHVR